MLQIVVRYSLGTFGKFPDLREYQDQICQSFYEEVDLSIELPVKDG